MKRFSDWNTKKTGHRSWSPWLYQIDTVFDSSWNLWFSSQNFPPVLACNKYANLPWCFYNFKKISTKRIRNHHKFNRHCSHYVKELKWLGMIYLGAGQPIPERAEAAIRAIQTMWFHYPRIANKVIPIRFR